MSENVLDQLNRIAELEKELTELRQKTGTASSKSFKVGDLVQIDDPQLRPKYMNGVFGKITKINKTTATISIDEDQGRFRAGLPIRVPMASLTFIS